MSTHLDYIWTLVAAILVFFMQPGFMALEVGLVRSKNSINVAIKNFIDFVIATVTFLFLGFNMMFGDTYLGIIGRDISLLFETFRADIEFKEFTFWFFHVVFAGTAATIVSGAIAERTRFSAYLFISFSVSLIIYPIYGHWVWGNLLNPENVVWLADMGFVDFAGSSVVHSIGGWSALAAAILIGPRIGKYGPNGEVNKIHPHNLGMATLGVFILWFGWFGFNGGSINEGIPKVGIIIANTNIGAAFGALAALTFGFLFKRTFSIEWLLNGALGGLVSITANCNLISAGSAIAIGAIGGIIVNLANEFIEKKLKVDDPVGAIAVHGFGGVWGTLAVALFIPEKNLPTKDMWGQLGVQSIGILVAFLWAFGITFLILFIYKQVKKIRPSAEEEKRGLNFAEHGAISVLTDTATAMSQVAEARGDLTQRVEAELGDEIGEISILFNKVLDWLHDTVFQFKSFSGQITHISHELVGKVKNTEELIYKMIDSMGEVDYHVEVHDEIIMRAKARLEHLVEYIAQVSGDTHHQSNYVHNSSQSIEDMVQSIQEVANMADRAYSISMNLKQIAETGGEDIRNEIIAIEEIEKYSHQVVEIINIINNISSKTHLLAMNAAIEAAHAGESGKGFAVVAGEIRKLAANTANSTKSIAEIIQIMSEKIQNAVETANQAEHALNNILTDVQETAEINTLIAKSTNEQLKSSQEVLQTVQALTRITESIETAMKEQEKDSQEIAIVITELVNIAKQIKVSVDRQMSFSYRILKHVLEVENAAKIGDELAKELGLLIQKFKLAENPETGTTPI